MPREFKIGARPVNERGSPLSACASEILRVENQAAGPCEHERRPMAPRKAKDVGSGSLVRIAAHSLPRVALRVERISVVQLNAVVLIKEEAIARQHPAAVCGALLDAILGRALNEASECLNRHVILVGR